MLEQAIKGDPKNPTYHYHLGLAYQKANDCAMAKKELEYAVLKVDPTAVRPTKHQAVVVMRQDRNVYRYLPMPVDE
jgi:Tfp pilus assembly protein PilF